MQETYTFSQNRVQIGGETITELHQSGKINWKNSCPFDVFRVPVICLVTLLLIHNGLVSKPLITYPPLSLVRSCSGFLAVLHVRPGRHILWYEDPSPDVSWNPAVHHPAQRPHWHNLRLGSQSKNKPKYITISQNQIQRRHPLSSVLLSHTACLPGLCGNNNNDTTDDFTTSSGIIENSAQPFAQSWSVGACAVNIHPCINTDNGTNYKWDTCAFKMSEMCRNPHTWFICLPEFCIFEIISYFQKKIDIKLLHFDSRRIKCAF